MASLHLISGFSKDRAKIILNGGSGTESIVCRFLGVDSFSFENNEEQYNYSLLRFANVINAWKQDEKKEIELMKSSYKHILPKDIPEDPEKALAEKIAAKKKKGNDSKNGKQNGDEFDISAEDLEALEEIADEEDATPKALAITEK